MNLPGRRKASLNPKTNAIMKKRILSAVSVCLFLTAAAQQTPATQSNYDLPARFSPDNVRKMIFSTSVDARWLKHSDRFWYSYQTPAGTRWYIVDPAAKSKKELFDPVVMAAELTRIVKDPFDAQHLPVRNLKFQDDENLIRFEIPSTLEVEKQDDEADKDTTAKKKKPEMEKKTFYFEYDIRSRRLKELTDYKKPKETPGWAGCISPDSTVMVFARDYNLYWMDSTNYKKAIKNENDSTVVEHQLTTEGIKNFAFGGGYDESEETDKTKIGENKKKRHAAWGIEWSPDSKHFAMMRTDSRSLKDFWVINSLASPRPALEKYKYQMPGEEESPITHLYVFDMEAKTYSEIDIALFKDQTAGILSADVPKKIRYNSEWVPDVWMGDNAGFYFTRTSRDLKRIDICHVDIASARVKAVIEERMNVYIDMEDLKLINNGKELIHWSERDGWGHLYLYGSDGTLKNQITSGPFHVASIEGVDDAKRVVYFTANGREPDENPYYKHLYRVNFDGSGLKLLNPGDFNAAVSMCDDTRFFVSNFSRVDTTPTTDLYDNTGKKIMTLETADLSNLLAAGYKFPEPFTVKAADGITDLYGVMYKPYDFDSTKTYPIIEYVYPGPQTEAVNYSFGRIGNPTDRLAQFGFIVVTVGNRGGSPERSKWYHTYGYGNLRDYGLEDKKVTVEQLADRHPYIDKSRVGIHGHSGGGFMSTAAMLVYPNFFKVAVSCAGNHENNIYNRWWSEKHHGVLEKVADDGDTTFIYQIAKNSEVAKNLKGRLLLVTGDMDNNVNPANTLRVVDALIKANKRFDMLILPGQRHGFGDMTEYFFWRMGDYFTESLLGDSENTVDIPQMNR